MSEPRSPSRSGSLFGRTVREVHENESGCVQSPEEAAALQFSLHQGPARPPLPMRHFRPAKEPSLKPSGGWVFSLVTEFSFHGLKLTATTLGALVPRARRVCSPAAPILPCSDIGNREAATQKAALTGSKTRGQLLNLSALPFLLCKMGIISLRTS